MATARARPPGPIPTESAGRSVSETIRQLVEAGDVDEARRLAPGTAWERVLGRPRATMTTAAPFDPTASQCWLNDPANVAAHAGHWVALRGGQVVAASADYASVQTALADVSDAASILVSFVPA